MFTSGLEEVFAFAAAAFFHHPKALLRRACKGYLIPSLPIEGIIGDWRWKVKQRLWVCSNISVSEKDHDSLL